MNAQIVPSGLQHVWWAVPVLVLSADSFNDRKNASPFCAPIVRQRGATELPPYAVALTEQDPITGVVVVNLGSTSVTEAGSDTAKAQKCAELLSP